MLSCESHADTGIRQLVSLVAGICFNRDFQALKDELEQFYAEAGYADSAYVAFEDALYTFLMQSEEQIPGVKELLAAL